MLKVSRLRGLHDGDEHKVGRTLDGGVGGGESSRGGRGRRAHTRVVHQGAQTSGAENQLGVLRVHVEVPLVPLVPALDGQNGHQFAVIWEAAHHFPWQPGGAAAEGTHHSTGRRLAQVLELGETFGTQTVAAVQHLGSAAAQVVQAVADLTLQLL